MAIPFRPRASPVILESVLLPFREGVVNTLHAFGEAYLHPLAEDRHVGATMMLQAPLDRPVSRRNGPVAVSMANRPHVSVMPIAIMLMMRVSCAIIGPADFQTLRMIQEPGGYRFGDYATVGAPQMVLVAVMTVLMRL